MADHRDLLRLLEPWGAATIEEDLSGFRNRVWSIRIAGERFIARQPLRESDALDWELDLLETLHDNGFHVTLPVRTAAGQRHVDGLVVFTFVSGTRPQSPQDWRLVGRELRRLHTITEGWPQRPGFLRSRELLTANSGSDADMSLLPPADAALCREAWAALPDEGGSVVHGDPSRENVVIDGDRVGLFDWDEARVDSPLLDLGALPDAEAAGFTPEQFKRARRASVAWEAAVCWQIEPDYAQRRMKELRKLSAQS